MGVFKSIFLYWNNTTDTPFLQSKVNMFFFLNLRVFKIKLNSYITFAITSLNSLKYKNIKVFYNVFCFEYFYYRFLIFSLVPLTLFFLI